ncbi:hypothetical protein ABNX05_09815 [Lysinibacillus sp. M3]|uniref:Uncharacterized protein n=1 Tax=Lysinibacillus zambalensis TaxID=3160866 RepID=A0ABV1MSN2_9BACI
MTFFTWLLYHGTVREYMVANDFTLISYIVCIVLGLLYGVLLDAFIYLEKDNETISFPKQDKTAFMAVLSQ